MPMVMALLILRVSNFLILEFEDMLNEEPEHPEREKEDVLRAFKFIAEDPTYITKKKIDEIISDKRYVPEVYSFIT